MARSGDRAGPEAGAQDASLIGVVPFSVLSVSALVLCLRANRPSDPGAGPLTFWRYGCPLRARAKQPWFFCPR